LTRTIHDLTSRWIGIEARVRYTRLAAFYKKIGLAQQQTWAEAQFRRTGKPPK